MMQVQRMVRILLGRMESNEFALLEACQNGNSTGCEFEWCTTNVCIEPLDGFLSSALPQIRDAPHPLWIRIFSLL